MSTMLSNLDLLRRVPLFSLLTVAQAEVISGAVIKVVQALVRRGGAKGFERATGYWPGDEKL